MSEKDLGKRVEGFVLAGGRSSRFGSDKALALLHGRTLLCRATALLSELGLRARVVTPDPSAYGELAAGAVTDERPGLGPTEGLRVALDAATSSWAMVLAVDMPAIDAAALQVLADALPEESPGHPRAVCFRDPSGRRCPLPGLYHRSLAADLAALPEDASLQRVLDVAAAIAFPAPAPDQLANVNTARDLARLAGGSQGPPEAKADLPGPESD